jgi:hypothetical protein
MAFPWFGIGWGANGKEGDVAYLHRPPPASPFDATLQKVTSQKLFSCFVGDAVKLDGN